MKTNGENEESVGVLVGKVANHAVRLARAEISSAKDETIKKTKELGVGIGLIAAAVVLSLFILGFFFLALFFAYANIMSSWLAAIVTALTIAVVATILALMGKKNLKKGAPPAPTETVESVKEDVHTMKEAL